MLMRFDPFREFDRFTEELRGQGVSAYIPMDAYRHGDQFVVHFDLPGVDPSSIDLTVEKDVLTLQAERSWPRQDGDQVVVSERPYGAFSRQLFLGEALDPDHVEAHYDHGVLTITVPVAEAAKPKKVEITSGTAPKAIGAQVTQSAA